MWFWLKFLLHRETAVRGEIVPLLILHDDIDIDLEFFTALQYGGSRGEQMSTNRKVYSRLQQNSFDLI